MRGRLLTLTLFCTGVLAVYGAASCALPAVASQGAALDAGRVSSAPRELTADEQIAHAVSRLTFGAKPGDVARVQAMGVDRWIDMQLNPDPAKLKSLIDIN